MKKWLPVIFILLTGISCTYRYQGDGVFLDRGPSTAADRYILDLGVVGPGDFEFAIGELPNTEFVIGFNICDLKRAEAEAESGAVEGQIEVYLDSALLGSSSLDEWVWTSGHSGSGCAFAYLRERRQTNESTGTYFYPDSKAGHRLRVVLPSAEFFKAHEVHLLVRGGGWK